MAATNSPLWAKTGRNAAMTLRHAALVLSLTSAFLAVGQPARAGTNDILIGLDEKITYDANGSSAGPGGKDAVLVVDISNPAKPKIRASLPPRPIPVMPSVVAISTTAKVTSV
jgi:hypothetical protein